MNREKLLKYILAVLYAYGGRAKSKLHIEATLLIASKHIDELREAISKEGEDQTTPSHTDR